MRSSEAVAVRNSFSFRSFMMRVMLAVAIVGSWGIAEGQDVVCKELTFPDDNNASNHVNGYTSTWTAQIGTDDEWTISNFNNNSWNNNWTYIRAGRKNNTSVATIETSSTYPEVVNKVDITIDAITDNKINSIKLYTSSDGSTWTEAGSYSKAHGTQSVSLRFPAANLYYKIEFDCAKGNSNGLITVSKVEYYARKYDVTWSINGVQSSDTYAEGHHITDAEIPTPTSSDCDGSKVFVGWTNSPIATPQNSAPTPLYSSSTLPTVTGNATYYAVFAAPTGENNTEWHLVTSASNMTSGTYVIGAIKSESPSDNYYIAKNELTTGGSNKDWIVTSDYVTISNQKLTSLPNGSAEFEFAGNNTNGYTIKNNNNSYLGYTDIETSRRLAFSAGYSTIKWNVRDKSNPLNSGGIYLQTYDGSSYYNICENSTGDGPIRGYKSNGNNNIYRAIYLFKKTLIPIYSDFVTECEEPSCPAPTNLDVSDITATTANISWNGTADNYQVRYAAMQTLMFEGFETGIPDGWQNVDADGDGHSWMQSSVLMSGYSINPYGGVDMLSSESYDSDESNELTPDNWLITSQITLPDVDEIKIKFYVAAQDEDYSEEHYGVYLSTTGSGIADFDNELLIETLPENSDIWHEKVIDITSYKGRSVYIAIRHFNCTDQFYLNIDDFGIYYKEWLEEETSNTSLDLTGLTPNTEYEVQVRADCEDDEYSSWISATFTTICGVIELPYFLGFEDGFSCWSLENCDASTGLSSDAAKTGNAGFLFSYNTNPPQYLISPRINATEEFHLRFYYKNYSDRYPETFQVGYSTGGSRGVIDENSFTWSSEITADDENNWMEYSNAFPAGTQYIAIKLTSDDQFSLFIDDIDIYYNYPLPIELTHFTANCNGRSALIEWTTATEKNNDYFVLERSHDAVNFKEIARIAGAGNSIEPISYAYTDYGVRNGDNYYRLVQVDYDGTSTASEIIVANCLGTDGEPEVLAYPNPFGDDLTLRFENFGNIQATVEVYDMLGRMVHTQKVNCSQNDYEVVLRLAGLSDGTYNVRISAKEFVLNRQVIKN